MFFLLQHLTVTESDHFGVSTFFFLWALNLYTILPILLQNTFQFIVSFIICYDWYKPRQYWKQDLQLKEQVNNFKRLTYLLVWCSRMIFEHWRINIIRKNTVIITRKFATNLIFDKNYKCLINQLTLKWIRCKWDK